MSVAPGKATNRARVVDTRATRRRRQAKPPPMALLASILAAIFVLVPSAYGQQGITRSDSVSSGDDWPSYQGSPGQTHYSKLDQINTTNVTKLQLAWVVDTGDGIDAASFSKSDM